MLSDEWPHEEGLLKAAMNTVPVSGVLHYKQSDFWETAMFVVTVRFAVEPGKTEEFLPLMLGNARTSLSDEPGCQRFDVCQHPETPGEVFLYEIYDDVDAFETHKTTPHYIDFSRATEALVTSKAVQTYRLVD